MRKAGHGSGLFRFPSLSVVIFAASMNDPKARYFLEIAYLGSSYHGWQVQKNAKGVQAIMNEKISLILGEEVYCIGCGRTDTGVHAKKFFLHFDSSRDLGIEFVRKLNIFLPNDIAVKRIFSAPGEAHARWSAISRSYCYIVSTEKDPFAIGYSGYVFEKLNLSEMKKAAASLLKYNDFEALSKINKQNKHHLCTMFSASWEQKDARLYFNVSANRFLRGMVRVIVGTMIEIGKGKMTINEFEQLIESKDRKKAGPAVAAEGLYLVDVNYPDGLLKEISN